VIISIDEEEAYRLVEQMGDLIDADVAETWKNIGIVGSVGFIAVLMSIMYIAHSITKPLAWMRKVAGMVIDNAGGELRFSYYYFASHEVLSHLNRFLSQAMICLRACRRS